MFQGKTFSTLKTEVVSSSETSTPTYQTKRRMPEDRNLDTHRTENVKDHRKTRILGNFHYVVIYCNGRNFKILTFHCDNLTTWTEFQRPKKMRQICVIPRRKLVEAEGRRYAEINGWNNCLHFYTTSDAISLFLSFFIATNHNFQPTTKSRVLAGWSYLVATWVVVRSTVCRTSEMPYLLFSLSRYHH